jgi:hypothetical protein
MNYVVIQEYHYNVRLHLLKFMRAHENLLRRTRPGNARSTPTSPTRRWTRPECGVPR